MARLLHIFIILYAAMIAGGITWLALTCYGGN